MTDDAIIEFAEPLPRIVLAYVVRDRLLHVVLRYPDHMVKKTVDLAPVLWRKRIFLPLRVGDVLFATLRINVDGTAIEFGDGDIDISAESIERLAPVGAS